MQGTTEERFATDGDYWADLDIVSAQSGFDDDYFYGNIELYAPTRFKPNPGENEAIGLDGEYRIQFGRNGGVLVNLTGAKDNRDDNSSASIALNSWRTDRNFAFRDTDGDLDLGENPSDGLQDNGSGYEEEIVNDGIVKPSVGLNAGATAIYSRIREGGTDVLADNNVEFVIDYKELGFTKDDLYGLDITFEANRGNSSSESPDNYLVSRQFRFTQAGSPYRCGSGDETALDATLAGIVGGCSDSQLSIVSSQGLVDVNEVDNLRGTLAPIPVPAALPMMLLGIASFGGLAAWRRRTARRA